MTRFIEVGIRPAIPEQMMRFNRSLEEPSQDLIVPQPPFAASLYVPRVLRTAFDNPDARLALQAIEVKSRINMWRQFNWSDEKILALSQRAHQEIGLPTMKKEAEIPLVTLGYIALRAVYDQRYIIAPQEQLIVTRIVNLAQDIVKKFVQHPELRHANYDNDLEELVKLLPQERHTEFRVIVDLMAAKLKGASQNGAHHNRSLWLRQQVNVICDFLQDLREGLIGSLRSIQAVVSTR